MSAVEAQHSGALRPVRPPKSVLNLAGLAFAFCVALILTAGVQFSDLMLRDFWVTLSPDSLEPEWQFIMGNALYNLFGHALTLANGERLSKQAFKAIGVIMVAACFGVLFASSVVRFSVERAAIFLGCVALTTLDSTLLHWIGKADPLFVCSYLLLFFGRKNVWLTALGAALIIGFHREQGTFVAGIHVLVLMLEGELTMSLLLALAAGFLVGHAGVELYNQSVDMDNARGRLDYSLGDGASVLIYSIKFTVKFIGLSLPSVLMGGWWLAHNAMRDWRSTLLLLAAIGVGTGVAATTHDFTRVASLLLMPVTFYLAEDMARRWRVGDTLPLKTIVLLAGVALIGYEVQDNRVLNIERPFIGLGL